jgi:hypothetical protein
MRDHAERLVGADHLQFQWQARAEAAEVAAVYQPAPGCPDCDHGLMWDPRVQGNVVPCPTCYKPGSEAT